MKETQQARDYFENSGLTYRDVGSIECFSLVECVREELKLFNVEFEKKEGHWIKLLEKKTRGKTPQMSFYSDGSIKEFYIHCKGSWFDRREAISFNKDGFIGFAGWASSENVKPFIKAFVKWCDETSGKEVER